jgi:hypothetical protein
MFQKGQSGNPAGPAKGTRHKITMLAEKLLEDDRDAIVRAEIAAAKGGDPTAFPARAHPRSDANSGELSPGGGIERLEACCAQ